MTPQRSSRLVMALALALAAVPMATRAQAPENFPNKTVTLVVPFVPGGGTDTGARLIGQKLAAKWGQSVVVDNRGGAGGILGVDIVARAKPDGYTLLMGNVGTQAINPYLYARLPYDPARAFAPVSMVADLPLVLVVNPQFKAPDVKALIALGRGEPGKYSYASSGTGNSTHLAFEIFQAASGARFQHVPYKGGGQANADVVAGHVPMEFITIFGTTGFITGGTLKPLAVASAARSAALPNVPTLAEAGLPNAELASWIGILAPAATPRALVEKISADIREVVAMPDVREAMVAQGAEPRSNTPQDFQKAIDADMQRFSALIRRLDLRAE
ncbi:tripartite tricarboxylate transporter substrate binding protein [Xylophilus rhododendri]|uniref:Tripartite tricarboxylate transporter substrate binding protein n=1 Tax=Xylophilus rhododendri TaxID=2697032 RepID=A0A857J0Y6_9BURK|nr:tripartite tricarboxylate transporter substrate binding protein [Xylophilus rhododendri]QHI97544.1 tripartite tricarboxylate transporter substrate binding protein [Xylophilus rhododendri]